MRRQHAKIEVHAAKGRLVKGWEQEAVLEAMQERLDRARPRPCSSGARPPKIIRNHEGVDGCGAARDASLMRHKSVIKLSVMPSAKITPARDRDRYWRSAGRRLRDETDQACHARKGVFWLPERYCGPRARLRGQISPIRFSRLFPPRGAAHRCA